MFGKINNMDVILFTGTIGLFIGCMCVYMSYNTNFMCSTSNTTTSVKVVDDESDEDQSGSEIVKQMNDQTQENQSELSNSFMNEEQD